MARSKFTEEERNLIKACYEAAGDGRVDMEGLIKALNSTYSTVVTIANRMGLSKRGRIKVKERYTILESGCWHWNLALDSKGYGYSQAKYGTTRAHIQYYIEKYGLVPEGLELDHLCRNRRCVNPDHLEPVTHTTNMRRGKATKIPQEIVEEIRELYATGRYTYKDLGKLFNLVYTTIWNIINIPNYRKSEKLDAAKNIK